MDLFLAFILFAAFVGLLCWAEGFIPQAGPFQTLVIAAGVIVVVIAFLQFLGVSLGLPHVNFIR